MQSTTTVFHLRWRGRRSSLRKMSAPAATALEPPPSGGDGPFNSERLVDPVGGKAFSAVLDEEWVSMAISLISLFKKLEHGRRV
jgi:hypothetical protein